MYRFAQAFAVFGVLLWLMRILLDRSERRRMLAGNMDSQSAAATGPVNGTYEILAKCGKDWEGFISKKPQ